MSEKNVIIIGAGPAGLTAGYEILSRTEFKPIIFEATSDIGGISKTVKYKGNRIDIGGHRFFSKSDRVVEWWQNIIPLQTSPAKDDLLLERQLPLKGIPRPDTDPEKTDKVMLFRSRLSRILFLRKFFDYPISINFNTFANLGVVRIFKIFSSYLKIRLFPIEEEKNLEDFFINRFGAELYRTFFENYTEKVWGVPCRKISPKWGAQRIKGLSITKAILHALKSIFKKDRSVGQKKTETSLIEQFMYPKFGPGQMWEEVNRLINEKGGQTFLNHQVIGLKLDDNKISEVQVKNTQTGETSTHRGQHIFSTMPVKDLIAQMQGTVPSDIRRIAQGLVYRDFLTVGLLLKELKVKNKTKIKTVNNIVPDNWIYVQEPDVKLCRLQIFNNWSPYMVKDLDNAWVGLEYMCNEGDSLWNKEDGKLTAFAIDELSRIGIIDKENVLDQVVIRMPKTYPAYFGTYDQFEKIINFTNGVENLFLIGRNGMHRYNNQDHSMLTAMEAVENIVRNKRSKENIWAVNAEEDYHEKK